MKIQRFQIILACLAVLSSAVAAEAMIPRTLMVRTADSLDLEKIIPRRFAEWTLVPDIRLVEPPEQAAFSHWLYNQQIARGYADSDGHVVMLLIAYGSRQNDRLELHRPEVCYAAQGFRVSRPTAASLAYSEQAPPISLKRLVAQREARFEPVTYWMRIGNDVATGVVEQQLLKVNYGLRGLVPDGALIRISTTGLPERAAFEIESKFIQDLLQSVDPATRKFLVGDPAGALSWRL